MTNKIEVKKNTARKNSIVLTVIIVLVNSGYYRSTATDSYIPLIALMALCAFLVFTQYDKLTCLKGSFLPFVLINAIIFSVLANFGMSNLLSGIRVGATMLCAYMLTRVFDVKNFSRAFSIAMKTLIIITFLFEAVIAIGVKSFPVIGRYYDLFIVTNVGTGARAHSIFWEPGVFASMILISLIFEYYIAAGKVTLVGLGIYIIGFLLSSSTAGFLLMFMALTGLLWRRSSESKQEGENDEKSLEKNPKRIFNVGVVVFVLTIALLFVMYDPIVKWFVDINPNIFGKLIETDSETTATRLNVPIVNLEVFFEKPILGWGFTSSSSEILMRISTFEDANIVAQTSTSTQIMAAIGIVGIFYSLGFIAHIFSAKKLSHLNIEMKIIVAVCMLFIVNKEPHLFIVASWMMLFYVNQRKNYDDGEKNEQLF